MKKLRNKITTIVLIILIISSFFHVFAQSEIANTQNQNQENGSGESNTTNSINDTNSVRQLTLEEQKNQVQEQLADANNKLTYVEGELSSKLLYIQRIEDKIAEYQVDVDDVNEKYRKLEEEVAQAEEELEISQAEFDQKDGLLRKRLVQIYKAGSSTTYLDVLLGSKDIFEFISNYSIISQIIEYDSKDIEQLAEKKNNLEQLTTKLNNQKAELKLAKVNAEKKTVLLANTKTVLENEKASLDESETTLLAQIDSYKKQQEEIERLISNSISASTYDLVYSGGVMIWPTVAGSYITSPFGSRLHPIQGVVKNHDGIDIGGSDMYGKSIYAAADGVIIYYGVMGGYGNAVMIDHGTSSEGKKVVTLYGHGSQFIEGLSVGSTVKQGQEIMKVGSTGNSTGPHLHFEVRENNVAVDPKKYLSSEQ